MHHFTRQPLSIVDLCEDNCGLCATLGCLRPELLDGETFRVELDLIELSSASAVVLPPSSLLHPELDSMIREIRNRGLEPIVRLRPHQLIAKTELVSTLEFRGARFELVIDRPVSEVELLRIEEMSSHIIGTVIVLNRRIDAEAIIESLPARLRSSVSLLAPAETGDSFYSPDAIYRLTSKSTLKDVPSAGFAQGRARFLETGLRATAMFARERRDSSSIRLSVIVPVHDSSPLPCLDSLATQTLPPDQYELIVVCDRTSAARKADVEIWMRAAPPELVTSLLVLEDAGVDSLAFRAGVARNAGAFRARGDLLLFLDCDAVAPRELLEKTTEAHSHADVVQFMRHDSASETEEYWTNFYACDDWMNLHDRWKYVSSFALSVKLADFLAVGGFPAVLNRYGCEDTFLGWKLDRKGLRFVLENLVVEHVGPSPRRASTRAKMKRIAHSARAFYLSTLDPDVYRVFFPVLGRSASLRWALRSLARMTT